MEEVTVPTKAGAANTSNHILLTVSIAYSVVFTFGSSPGKAGHIARDIPTERRTTDALRALGFELIESHREYGSWDIWFRV
jgi:hypothetical protein